MQFPSCNTKFFLKAIKKHSEEYSKTKTQIKDPADPTYGATYCVATANWLMDEVLVGTFKFEKTKNYIHESINRTLSEKNVDSFIDKLNEGCFYFCNISEGSHAFILEACNEKEGFLIYQSDIGRYTLKEWLQSPEEPEYNNFCADLSRVHKSQTRLHFTRRDNFGGGKIIGRDTLRTLLTGGYFNGGFTLPVEGTDGTLEIIELRQPGEGAH